MEPSAGPAAVIFDFEDMLVESPTLPELLAALQASGVQTAAVAERALIDVTRPFGSAINVVYDRKSVRGGQPGHNLFVVTAEWFRFPPERCCGIGSSVAAIEAIAAAGMCPIAVGKPANAEELGKAGAFRVFRDLLILTTFRIEQAYHDWCIERMRERGRQQATQATAAKSNNAPS